MMGGCRFKPTHRRYNTNLSCPGPLPFGIKNLEKLGVIPVVDDVVGPIMYFDFHSVAPVVQDENDGAIAISDHSADFLRGQIGIVSS